MSTSALYQPARRARRIVQPRYEHVVHVPAAADPAGSAKPADIISPESRSPEPREPQPVAESRTGANFAALPGDLGAVYALWQMRPCLICSRPGVCEHRELAVDLARIEGARRAEAARKAEAAR